MAIASFIITVAAGAAGEAALAALTYDQRCTLGPHRANRHALVVDGGDTRAPDREDFTWIAEVPGVLRADLVSAHYPETDCA